MEETLRKWKQHRLLYLLLLPGILYFVLFKYVPMWGVLVSFQEFQPFKGFAGSEWVGFAHFREFFAAPEFAMLFRNTFILAIYNIVFFFPLPILLSLMINEVRQSAVKKWVQTTVYVPHFISWVVVVGIAYIFFTTEGGLVNEAVSRLGFDKIPFLIAEEWFRPMIIGEAVWKESGWGTIIFLAALAGVDTGLYDAAQIDGAGRWRQMWNVTLPSIRSTIIILLILRLGTFLDTGFEQIYLMLNAINRNVGEVFDTYVYTTGITQGKFSYSTAVGLFKSVVGFILVISANYAAKKLGEEGVY